MGLISRVSSRTYRKNEFIVQSWKITEESNASSPASSQSSQQPKATKRTWKPSFILTQLQAVTLQKYWDLKGFPDEAMLEKISQSLSIPIKFLRDHFRNRLYSKPKNVVQYYRQEFSKTQNPGLAARGLAAAAKKSFEGLSVEEQLQWEGKFKVWLEEEEVRKEKEKQEKLKKIAKPKKVKPDKPSGIDLNEIQKLLADITGEELSLDFDEPASSVDTSLFEEEVKVEP